MSRRRREWGKETGEVTRVGKNCQGRKVCQVSGSRAVNRKDCQDSQMSSANRIERKWQHQKRKSKESPEKDVQGREKTSKQTAGKGKASKFRDVKGKLDQEKVGIRQGWHEEEMSRRKESNR